VLPIAGDDADAKKVVSYLLDRLGYDAYDVGPLAEGWRYQRDTAAYVGLYTATDDQNVGQQVTTSLLEDKLRAASRYRDLRG
jgi:predicted dinucleotide-binding enzyme